MKKKEREYAVSFCLRLRLSVNFNVHIWTDECAWNTSQTNMFNKTCFRPQLSILVLFYSPLKLDVAQSC